MTTQERIKVICEISVPHYHPGEDEEVAHFTQKRLLSQDEHWVANEKKGFDGVEVPVIMPPRKEAIHEWTITAWHKHFKGVEPVFSGAQHIVKLRHLHCNLESAEKFGLTEGQMLSVEKKDGPRPGRLDGVVVRITPWGVFRVHLDTDEANALYIKNGDEIDLIIARAPGE